MAKDIMMGWLARKLVVDTRKTVLLKKRGKKISKATNRQKTGRIWRDKLGCFGWRRWSR